MMQHYNLDQVELMADGDEAFIREMVEAFLSELPSDIQAFNQAVENENAKMAFEISHKFKPNLILFGLDLSQQIKSLEKWSQGYLDHKDIQYYTKEITRTVENACEEMRTDFKLN